MNKKNTINNQVIGLGLVSFFTDMASEMIFSILPIFLLFVLGINSIVIGLLEGLAEFSVSVFKIFSGFYSDKLKKYKFFSSLGYIISNLSKPLLAISSSLLGVFLIRLVDRVGKGIRGAPRDTLLSLNGYDKKQGGVFGFHRTLDNAGAVVGIIISIILLYFVPTEEGIRDIFAYSILPGIISIFIVLFLINNKKTGDNKIVKKKENISNGKIKVEDINRGMFSGLGKDFFFFLGISLLFSLSVVSYTFFLIKAMGTPGVEIYHIPLFYLYFNLVQLVIAYPAGLISDYIGKKNVLIIGFALYALLCFIMSKDISFAGLLFAFLLYGLFMAIFDGVGKAFISEITPKNKKSTAIGLYNGLTGFVFFISNVLFGVLIYLYDINTAFTFSYIVAILSIILIMFGYKLSKNSSKI